MSCEGCTQMRQNERADRQKAEVDAKKAAAAGIAQAVCFDIATGGYFVVTYENALKSNFLIKHVVTA